MAAYIPPIWKGDPYLLPYKDVILRRFKQCEEKACAMQHSNGLLSDACNGHLYYGLHKTERGWTAREWAPNASALYLIGECNGWEKRQDYAFRPLGEGNWELQLPEDGLRHLQLYKLWVEWPGGGGERIPAYATRCLQDPYTKIFSAQVWTPAKPYVWKHPAPPRVAHPLIYEAHVGMSSEEAKVSTFDAFRQEVLPRVARLGYNTLQLMAVQEHPYYGSFGYQVANFYAVSSRFGTPEDLMRLIDEAHGLGIAVILDLVHSHSVKNELEGLGRFDGTRSQYFHGGARGDHPVWESRCFNYGKDEVVHFLLSNCKYWLEVFHFDGFRFDGITSMVYLDHGIGRNFTDYSMYYDGNQDEDAICYLALANRLIHECKPQAITIAEDVSGLPGLAYPLSGAGLGFDFRMSMGVADQWQKLIKKVPDEQWHMGSLFYEMTNKRADEHTISYAECHDQAMVGDKTIIFSLIDKEMYTSMDRIGASLAVDRGVALHKLIRLFSLSTAGDGYLNFMGNEFGHPEWIDFPREGNRWSMFYARRQWSLEDNPLLLYGKLSRFDCDMVHLAKENDVFAGPPELILEDNERQVLAFRRQGLIFVFNFSPAASYTDLAVPVPEGAYRAVLDSDEAIYGGFGRQEAACTHFARDLDGKGQQFHIQVYLPSRTAMVLKKNA